MNARTTRSDSLAHNISRASPLTLDLNAVTSAKDPIRPHLIVNTPKLGQHQNANHGEDPNTNNDRHGTRAGRSM